MAKKKKGKRKGNQKKRCVQSTIKNIVSIDDSRKNELMQQLEADGDNSSGGSRAEWEALITELISDRNGDSLVRIADSNLHNKIRKLARTGLHRLKTQGVEIPEQTVHKKKVIRTSFSLPCLTTPVSFSGMRTLYLPLPPPCPSGTLFEVIVGEELVINEFRVSYSRLKRELSQKVKDSDNIIEVPLNYGIGLCIDAFLLEPKYSSEKYFNEYYTLCELYKEQPHPIDREESLDLAEIPVKAELDSLADIELFEPSEFPKMLQDELGEAQNRAKSLLILPRALELERLEQVISQVFDGFMTQAWREAIIKRLKDNGLLMQISGDSRAAARIRAVARCLEKGLSFGELRVFQRLAQSFKDNLDIGEGYDTHYNKSSLYLP